MTSAAGDAQLQHAIDRNVRAGHPRAVLSLHIALLQAATPRPYHRRIAKAILDDATQSHAGQVFIRGNADAVLICDPDAATDVKETLARVFRTEKADIGQLISLWMLPQDATEVGSYLGQTMTPASLPGEVAASPAQLQAILEVLATSPPDRFIGRQLAVEVVPGGMRPLFREIGFHIRALDAYGTPGTKPELPAATISADPNLFRQLATHLDGHIIKHVTTGLSQASEKALLTPLHINLTVRTVLSPSFLRLTERAEADAAVFGVEVAMLDACADPLAFAAARMALRAHRYPVVVEGLTHESLALCSPEALEPDLIKIDWSPQILALQRSEHRQLVTAINRIGPERFVLQRVQTAGAFAWGMAHGIKRFQGWHMDALQAAGRIAACQHTSHCTARQCIDRASATGSAGRTGCRDLELLDSAEIKLFRASKP